METYQQQHQPQNSFFTSNILIYTLLLILTVLPIGSMISLGSASQESQLTEAWMEQRTTLIKSVSHSLDVPNTTHFITPKQSPLAPQKTMTAAANIKGHASASSTTQLDSTTTPLLTDASATPFRVLATTTLAADLSRIIGGKYVTVLALMGPGIDPHLYKARENTVRLLGRAEVIVYHGLHLESKLGAVLERIAATKPVINLSTGIPEPKLIYDIHNGIADPHVWMDVALWKVAAKHLTTAFMELDPKHQSYYRARLKAYLLELNALEQEVQQTLTALLETARVLITAHDAFSYYGRAYALELKALQGISTTSRFNLYDLHKLKQFILDRRIPVIFAESSVSKRGLEALRTSLAASGYPITLNANLYSDSLGPTGSPGETYTKMIRHNTQTIVNAFQTAGRPVTLAKTATLKKHSNSKNPNLPSNPANL